MKQQFKEIRFRRSSMDLIETCNSIIDEYRSDGFRLTLRQLYYQLVTRNVIPNSQQEYKRLSGLISNARYAGLTDWSAIEDRTREPDEPREYRNIGELIDESVSVYRLPRWRGQEFYAELWVEKDALAGVLEPVARANHVTLMVNRGYSSTTAMKDAAERFLNHSGQAPVLLYLGDLDPSGEDMVRDVRDRLRVFGVEDVDVTKIAITPEQIRQYDPPPNPVKITDSRVAEYIKKFGYDSWEVDALPPNVLTQIVDDAITSIVDIDLMTEVVVNEDQDKEAFLEAVGGLQER